MPFATLPSSPGFVAPQAPDWTRFGLQANELIANQKIPDTSAIVDKAVGQINQILKLQSPEAKLQREVQMIQLQGMKEIYTDYKLHPEKYTMTAHGPVLTDMFARAERIARIKKDIASTALINKHIQPSGVESEISNLTRKMQLANKYKNQLPSSGAQSPEPLGQDTTDTTDTSEVTPVESAAMSDSNSPEEFDPSAPYNE